MKDWTWLGGVMFLLGGTAACVAGGPDQGTGGSSRSPTEGSYAEASLVGWFAQREVVVPLEDAQRVDETTLRTSLVLAAGTLDIEIAWADADSLTALLESETAGFRLEPASLARFYAHTDDASDLAEVDRADAITALARGTRPTICGTRMLVVQTTVESPERGTQDVMVGLSWRSSAASDDDVASAAIALGRPGRVRPNRDKESCPLAWPSNCPRKECKIYVLCGSFQGVCSGRGIPVCHCQLDLGQGVCPSERGRIE